MLERLHDVHIALIRHKPLKFGARFFVALFHINQADNHGLLILEIKAIVKLRVVDRSEVLIHPIAVRNDLCHKTSF